MAFLGMSLTCACCHNHPMEKWTQDQYYGVASLFSRVQLKDGGAIGDVVVMASPEGETRHPRSGAVMPPARSTANHLLSIGEAIAARLSPTGWGRPITPTSPERSSTESGGTSSAAA